METRFTSEFNWIPTSDLARRWPVSFLIWGAVIVGVLSIAAAYWYANAYAPGPVSRSHVREKMELNPPIAIKTNADSCTNCHSLTGSTETKCATCHNTQTFVATVIKPHAAAGIGCVSCHAEHQGSDFSPAPGPSPPVQFATTIRTRECTMAARLVLRMPALSGILWSMKSGRGRDSTTTATGRSKGSKCRVAHG